MKKTSFIALVLIVFPLFIFAQEITLEEVVMLALEKNYGVRIQRKSLETAQTDNRLLSVGAFLPQINTTASTVWNKTNQDVHFQADSLNRKGVAQSQNTAASANLTWILFDGTR